MTTEQSDIGATTALKNKQNKKTNSLFVEALAKLNSHNSDDINSAHPHIQKMFVLDTWRFVGWLIFVVDWVLKYVYYL
jgi:hypothetical protein